MKHICKKKDLEQAGVDYPNTCYLFRIQEYATSGKGEHTVVCVDCGVIVMEVKEIKQ